MQSTMSFVFLVCLLGGTSLLVSLIATGSLNILYNIVSHVSRLLSSNVLHSSLLSMLSMLVMLWCLLQINQAPLR